MVSVVLTDMDGNVLKRNDDIIPGAFFIKSELREEVPEISNRNFLDALPYGINVQKVINRGEDFLIYFMNKPALKFIRCDLDEAKGRYFSEFCPTWEQFGFFDVWREVYRTKESMQFRQLVYVEDVLVTSFIYSVFLIGDLIYQTLTDATDLFVLNQANMESIENSTMTVGIVQNGKWVYANKAFCEYNHVSLDNIGDFPFEMSNLKTQSTTKEELHEILDDILNRRRFFFSDDIYIEFGNTKAWLRQFVTPITYNNLPAIQIAAQIIDDEKQAELKVKELSDSLTTVQRLGKLAVGHMNNNSIHWSEGIYDIFELPPDDPIFDKTVDNIKNKTSHFGPFLKFVLKNDLIRIRRNIIKAKSEGINKINVTFRIRTAKGNIKSLALQVLPNFNDAGNMEGVGYIQDITEEINYQNELKSILDEYEESVGDLEKIKSDLEENIRDKDILLKEIHHRVKNNLQIILSLLNLDLRFNEVDIIQIIKATQERINSIALIHEKVYESSESGKIDFKDYVLDIIHSLFILYNSRIQIVEEFKDHSFTMDKLIPLGLIVNEVVNNTIKYAFPNGENGKLFVSLKSEGDVFTFKIADDGIGFPDGFDFTKSNSLGLTVISSLTQQLEGNFKMYNDGGAVLEIQFSE